jgi:hypothetical protein
MQQQRFCRLIAVALLATLSLHLLCRAPAARAATQNPPAQMTPAQLAERLDKVFPALEALSRGLPRDSFDPAAIVETVGREPEALFRWVRDETALVAYQGTLRGPVGVLMDRAGNSLDRALLLHALLRRAGRAARLARATLTESQAQTLWSRLRPPPVKPAATVNTRPSRALLDSLAAKYAAQFQMEPAEFRRNIAAALQEADAGARRVDEAAQRSLRPAPAASRAERLAALREHWWVQQQEGAAWLDLDPTLPNAAPGNALAAAAATLDAEKLDARLRHTLEVRVVIEQWQNGKLTPAPVLAQTLSPAELYGAKIALRYAPMKWPRDLNLFAERNPDQKLKQITLAQNEWTPTLSVGDRMIAKKSFTAAGNVKEAARQTPLGGLLGAVTGALEGADDTQRKFLTAAWLEFVVRAPGQPERAARREVFDLVGPAARARSGPAPEPQFTEAQLWQRGLALLGETEILPETCWLTPNFVRATATQRLLANRAALLNLLRQGNVAAPATLRDALGRFKPLSSQLYALTLARQEAGRARGEGYLERLNVLSLTTRLVSNPQGDIGLRLGFEAAAQAAPQTTAKRGPAPARVPPERRAAHAQMNFPARADVEAGASQDTVESSLLFDLAQVAFLVGPFFLFGALSFFACAGRNPQQNSAFKNTSCLLCALLAGFCMEGMWLAKIDIGFALYECGFWIGVISGGPCALASFAID